ncbi:hypothetical protein T484DRAFT_1941635 [Baffinella frigidus]|nr:hypothetical protein T484DRAFT_1941635 [Cryptophyta sp. CCMP2293]
MLIALIPLITESRFSAVTARSFLIIASFFLIDASSSFRFTSSRVVAAFRFLPRSSSFSARRCIASSRVARTSPTSFTTRSRSACSRRARSSVAFDAASSAAL